MDEKLLKDLKKVQEIHGKKGNWDYDDYMLGMYNGMEVLMAIIEKRDPVFRTLKKSADDEWVSNAEKIIKSEIEQTEKALKYIKDNE